MEQLEKTIEHGIVQDAEAAGWWQTKVEKCSKRGMPDRLFIRRGRVVFLEVKRFGEVPTPQQAKRHRELITAGVECYWVQSRDAARVILK